MCNHKWYFSAFIMNGTFFSLPNTVRQMLHPNFNRIIEILQLFNCVKRKGDTLKIRSNCAVVFRIEMRCYLIPEKTTFFLLSFTIYVSVWITAFEWLHVKKAIWWYLIKKIYSYSHLQFNHAPFTSMFNTPNVLIYLFRVFMKWRQKSLPFYRLTLKSFFTGFNLSSKKLKFNKEYNLKKVKCLILAHVLYFLKKKERKRVFLALRMRLPMRCDSKYTNFHMRCHWHRAYMSNLNKITFLDMKFKHMRFYTSYLRSNTGT